MTGSEMFLLDLKSIEIRGLEVKGFPNRPFAPLIGGSHDQPWMSH